jgi:hypothetical protein
MTRGSIGHADLGSVFVVGHIAHPVQALLDQPVPSQEVGQFLQTDLERGQGGDRVDRFARPSLLPAVAGGDRFAAADDLDGLSSVREVQPGGDDGDVHCSLFIASVAAFAGVVWIH